MMLKGKNAVVTGAKGEIGKAIVETFAANGATVWACIRKPDENAEREFSYIAVKYGTTVKPIYMELGNDESVNSGVKTILDDKLPIDILVNNAGVTATALLSATTLDEIRRVYEINLFAPLLIIQKLSKRMIRQKKGSIINIASTAGIDNNPGRLAYGGSKSGLIYATKTLANELKPHGIRVNAIAPGPVETEMLAHYSQEQLQGFMDLTYDKRLGETQDIANAVLYLASEMSTHISGQILRVDGGM